MLSGSVGASCAPAKRFAPVAIKVPTTALLRSTCAPVSPYNSRRRALVCRAKYEDLISWEPTKNNPHSSNGRWHVGYYNAGVANGVHVKSVSENKSRLLKICKDLKISDSMTALMVAIAMLETDHMDVGQHDGAKDNYTDGSANVSIFNLNADLVKKTGYNHGQPLNAWQIHHLNTVEGTYDAVKILKKVFDMYGIYGGLHYIRGGQTGYQNPYGNPQQAAKIKDYDSGIKAILRQFDDDHSLLQIGDGRRVDVEVGYIAQF